jgi:hypothetical protein
MPPGGEDVMGVFMGEIGLKRNGREVVHAYESSPILVLPVPAPVFHVKAHPSMQEKRRDQQAKDRGHEHASHARAHGQGENRPGEDKAQRPKNEARFGSLGRQSAQMIRERQSRQGFPVQVPTQEAFGAPGHFLQEPLRLLEARHPIPQVSPGESLPPGLHFQEKPDEAIQAAGIEENRGKGSGFHGSDLSSKDDAEKGFDVRSKIFLDLRAIFNMISII